MTGRTSITELMLVQFFFFALALFYASSAVSQSCTDVVDGQGTSLSPSELEHQFDSGARWQMCWHVDAQTGLTLSNIAYGAPQEPVRKVLQSASLAQILLKYDEDRSAKQVLSEVGLGLSQHRVADALSCLAGEIHSGENNSAICVKLRNKNSLTSLRRSESIRRHELSLHAFSTVGSQSFEQVWRFSEDGQIIPAVRMGGELDRFTHQTEYGSPVKDLRPLAANASLLYTWRLNFNIADTEKNDLVEQVEFVPHENNTVRRSIDTQLIGVESFHRVNRTRFRGWLVKDEDLSSGSTGATRIGYYLDPQSSGFDFVSRIMNWANYDLAVSRNRQCEQLASGNDRYNSNCGNDLDDFVNGESLQGEDVTVWFSLARQFLPRAEDYPAISTAEAGFKLIPFDWSASTPFTALEE